MSDPGAQPPGELKMWGIPLSKLPAPPPPGQPSQEILDLHRKAIDYPDSLTDADRRRILQKLSPDEEDRLCREICGLSWNELVQKAISRPGELSDDEAHLVVRGVNYPPIRHGSGGPDYDFFAWLGQPKEEQDRKFKAESIAKTEDEKTASKNAHHQEFISTKRESDALLQLKLHDRHNIWYMWNKGLPWVQETQQLPAWGFVLFRTSFGDDDAWRRFKELLADAIEKSLLLVSFSARIRKTWTVQYIEDDETLADASLPQLCARFRDLCRNVTDEDAQVHRILPGIRNDAFLYVNLDAITSVLENSPLPQRGYVWAADPSFPFKDTITVSISDMTTPPFEGVVPVALTAVFTAFYARLDPAAASPPDPNARDTGCVKQNWDLVWRKSRIFYPPKTYPPPIYFNL